MTTHSAATANDAMTRRTANRGRLSRTVEDGGKRDGGFSFGQASVILPKVSLITGGSEVSSISRDHMSKVEAGGKIRRARSSSHVQRGQRMWVGGARKAPSEGCVQLT